ncbi:right-handed parallel beta-helix repeat-containing protein [Aquabacterium sp. A3]|uniref:right-handed parallel beta-helix repeat-containing protein n=1 Tax=Aquabacterium sp. A3 TaxID=3132829 RepID=UPI003119A653
MKHGIRSALGACLATFLLTACGGGGDASTSINDDSTNSRAAPAAIAPETSDDVVLWVAPSMWDATRLLIRTSRYSWFPTTINLDDLPTYVANHSWTKSAGASGSLRIKFEDGVYRMQQGWVWPATASGKDASRQVVLEKAASGDVLIMGSRQLAATYRTANRKVALSSEGLQFDQLWVEEVAGQPTRAIRARTPNAGSFFWVKGPALGWPTSPSDPTVVARMKDAPTTDELIEVSKQAFQADPNSLALLSQIVQQTDTDAVLQLMDSWQTTKHRMTEFDQDGQRVRFSPATYWPVGQHGHGQRYFIENTLSALDASGEWFLQRNGNTLHYIPSASVRDQAKLRFEVPVVSKLLVMEGNAANNQWVQYVQFKGLKFRYAKGEAPNHAQRNHVNYGYVDTQADVYVGAAIELNHARHIEFSNIEVSRTGGYALWMNDRVRDVRVEGSEMYDLGAGGVKVGKARSPFVDSHDIEDAANPLTTGAITLTGNRIYRTGHDYPGAVGVWIGRSSGNTVTDNLIRDTTYTGISVGWRWDTANSLAHGNQIRNNFLYNIGQGALSDMGGVYLLGRAPGTVVSGNVIKEVRSYEGYTGGSNGIYADEGSSELLVTGNIVLGTDSSGFSLHYGEENRVEDNVFANTRYSFGIGKRAIGNEIVSSAVPLRLTSNSLLPNRNDFVALSNDGTLMARPHGEVPYWLDPVPVMASNTVSAQYLPSGTALQIPTSLCTGCSASASLAVTDTGPLRVPSVTGKVLNPGVNVARSWDTASLANVVSASRMWSTSLAAIPPRIMDFRASQWPLPTEQVQGWQVISDSNFLLDSNDQNKPLTIRQSADGTPVLALVDTPRAEQRSYEPYIQSWMKHGSGTTTIEFEARFGPDTNLTHEWRADDSGAVSGPVVRFVSNGAAVDVLANDIRVTSVPHGQWAKVAITSPIMAGARWSVTVTHSGQTFTQGNLTPRNSNWSYLGPFLFITYSNTYTTTEFKSVLVTNSAWH